MVRRDPHLHGLYLILRAFDLDDLGRQLQTCCFLLTLVDLAKAPPAEEEDVVQREVGPSGRRSCRGIALWGFE